MGVFRDLTRRVLKRVGSIVAKDDLFEKPGERPTTPPLPIRPVQAAPAAAPAPLASPAPAASPAPVAAKPAP
ncbi:MAG: hypothetical protein Q8P18_07465, partial [Pseudomonadota bacterium]|nr:hypothetical protein [Pseudomonadota bacterium]